MTLRLRLALWYGLLLALVLAVALSLAYVAHASAHEADVDAGLRSSWERAAASVRSMPMAPTMLGAPQTSAGPTALWLIASGRDAPLASAGDIADRALSALVPRQVADGYTILATSAGPVRAYAGSIAGTDLRLVVAASVGSLEASLERLRWILLAMGAGGVLVAVAGGWAISGGALHPIATLTETARAIALSRGFSRRVHVPANERDELGELARTFNGMLTSLDDAYRRQQRFVGDVSHELRTPLTTIQGNAEILVRPDLEQAERLAAGALVVRESRRLARLVDDLLVLARADAGPQPFSPKALQLDEVLMEAFAELRPAAGPRLHVAHLEALVVGGERDRLKQLAVLLIDNALRYTPADGDVRLSLATEGTEAVLRIEDTGIGIAPEDATRVFERFYRGESARHLDPAGTGLGLAIARWIVERHGGTIALEARAPNGARVTVRLPLAPGAGVSADSQGALSAGQV